MPDLPRNLYLILVLSSAGILTAGCLRSLPASGNPDHGTYKKMMDLRADKFRRSYLVHLPPAADEEQPLPLVVVLHGAFDSGKKMEKLTGFSRIADREGFIALYPNGMGLFSLFRHWNSGHCCGRAQAIGVDDIAFLETVIDEVRRRFNIDQERIYITGNSNGGMLTHHMAARNSGLFTAAAVVSGTIGGRPTAADDTWRVPQPENPLPMMLIHGRADDIVPYEGGDDRRNKQGRTYLSVDESARFWAAVNGATPEPEEESLYGGRVALRRWDGETTAPVMVYAIEGWGHLWPGSATIKAGKDPELTGFDAAEVIWEFFKSQTRSFSN